MVKTLTLALYSSIIFHPIVINNPLPHLHLVQNDPVVVALRIPTLADQHEQLTKKEKCKDHRPND